jgi:hypothetical protein
VEVSSGDAPWNGTRTMSTFKPRRKKRSAVSWPKPMLMEP